MAELLSVVSTHTITWCVCGFFRRRQLLWSIDASAPPPDCRTPVQIAATTPPSSAPHCNMWKTAEPEFVSLLILFRFLVLLWIDRSFVYHHHHSFGFCFFVLFSSRDLCPPEWSLSGFSKTQTVHRRECCSKGLRPTIGVQDDVYPGKGVDVVNLDQQVQQTLTRAHRHIS